MIHNSANWTGNGEPDPMVGSSRPSTNTLWPFLWAMLFAVDIVCLCLQQEISGGRIVTRFGVY
jgi:hypothetical protein